MIKKVAIAALFVGLIGLLVTGAVIRTVDKTGKVVEAQGLGEGRGNGYGAGFAEQDGDCDGEGAGSERGGGEGGGRGGYGQGTGGAARQTPNYEAEAEDWLEVEGTVVQSPVDGAELVIVTDGGEEITVGTGPGYMEAQGFVLQAGERVQVQGYLDDGELRAARIMRLRDGQTVTLRDQTGRPAWAGGGKRALEQQAAAGRGQGGLGGQLANEAPGTGQAEVAEWLSVEGTVVDASSSALIVHTADSREIMVEGRPWRFALEQGFSAEIGDQVTLTGFYEGDEFEVGQISKIDGDRTIAVSVREESGRPLWAGRGRRGS
jgi:hypothetical protein